MNIKNICCIGAGYVGGPSMAVIALKCPHLQINVVDINHERIDSWNQDDFSKLPIYEPGLDKIISECRGRNLHFSTQVEDNIAKADMIFISVNTPTKTEGYGAGQAIDLKWVDVSARKISEFASGETIVVEKSTLPVKTAQTIKEILESTNSKSSNLKKFHVLSNPEFLAEGSAINDLINPDRVLIGGINQNAIKALSDIYSYWIDQTKIITTNLWSAELSKLIANAFLAQRVSSINSVTALCEVTGANIKDVSLAVGKDQRIGKYFLNPGPGFGGSCFKKDILNLVYICNHYGLYEVSEYWQGIININSWQKRRITKLIVDKLFGTISNKKIAILGFAFKANTNDTRESPAISICIELMNEGAHLNIFDPKVDKKQIKAELNSISKDKESVSSKINWSYCENIYVASREVDALVILTDAKEFKDINWAQISENMRAPAWVFDTKGLSSTKKAKKYNINVWSIGEG
tara:strand:+ start:3297 stop:4694 length:1398 start_codon:yes stop_codon:yes gene_type:complete